MNSLWFDKDLKNATDTPRIHHQLTPNEMLPEQALLQDSVRSSAYLSVYFYLFINFAHSVIQ